MWKYLMVVFLFIGTLSVQAQPGPRGERFDRIKEARETFFREKLSLTAEESEAFFPIFWKYETQIRKARRSIGPGRQGGNLSLDNLSEQQAQELLASNRKRRKELLDLEAEAEDAFLKVLPARKVVILHRAEKEFREKLIRRLRQERKGGPRN